MGYQSLWLFLYAQYAHIMFEIVPIALITNIVISIMASLLFIKLSKKDCQDYCSDYPLLE